MQFSKKRNGVKIFQPFIEPTFFNLFLTLDMNDSLGHIFATITDANPGPRGLRAHTDT